jgi:hypothetical protein
VIKVNLPLNKSLHVDTFNALNFLGDGYGTRSILSSIISDGGFGEAIEMWVKGYLTQIKFWPLTDHEKKSDYYDVILNNDIKIEIRKSSRSGALYADGRRAYYLNLNPTNAQTRLNKNSLKEKLKVLENGGYLLCHLVYSFATNIYTFHIFWFPTPILLSAFPVESHQKRGIVFSKLFPKLLPNFDTNRLY